MEFSEQYFVDCAFSGSGCGGILPLGSISYITPSCPDNFDPSCCLQVVVWFNAFKRVTIALLPFLFLLLLSVVTCRRYGKRWI